MLAFLLSQAVEMAYWLPISAFLAAILVLFPLPSYWRSRNVPILAIISWLFSVDLVQAVNSVIWLDNTRNVIPVWCDISKYFFLFSELSSITYHTQLPGSRLVLLSHFQFLLRASARIWKRSPRHETPPFVRTISNAGWLPKEECASVFLLSL